MSHGSPGTWGTGGHKETVNRELCSLSCLLCKQTRTMNDAETPCLPPGETSPSEEPVLQNQCTLVGYGKTAGERGQRTAHQLPVQHPSTNGCTHAAAAKLWSGNRLDTALDAGFTESELVKCVLGELNAIACIGRRHVAAILHVDGRDHMFVQVI